MVERLPSELLRSIGLKLDSATDRVRFRAVSKLWRSALPFRRPPMLMLMLATAPNNTIGFVNVGEETVFTIHFPETAELHHEDRVLGSTSNWAITSNSATEAVLCSNIFSQTQFDLPAPFEILPRRLARVPSNLLKVVLSPSPPPDVVAMGIYWRVPSRLAIVGYHDQYWSILPAGDPSMGYTFFEDCVFYQQRFYAVGHMGKIVACDIGDDLSSNPSRLPFLLHCSVDAEMSPVRKHYLVEVSGELLMVVRFLDSGIDLPCGKPNHRTLHFKMYKLDLVNLSFEEFKCLGDHSLFLGLNTSASVLAPDYFGLVRRNCIYFADDLVCRDCSSDGYDNPIQTNCDIGVFDVEDNSITPHFRSTPNSTRNPIIWIVPQQSE